MTTWQGIRARRALGSPMGMLALAGALSLSLGTGRAQARPSAHEKEVVDDDVETPPPKPAARAETPPPPKPAARAETRERAAKPVRIVEPEPAPAAVVVEPVVVEPVVVAPVPVATAPVEAEPVTVAPGPVATLPKKQSGNADSPDGLTWRASGWDITLYGYAALNVMQDSTQSFGVSSGNTIIQRVGTIRGNSLQAQASSRDSRLGLRMAAPAYGSIKASANVEMDFSAAQPIESIESTVYTNAGLRMRHYYMKVETPIVDILAGQYHDLFGWGGKGFYPSTLAFLGVTGEIYHRNPQIRLSKTIATRSIELEVAGALMRPVQKNGGYPDVQAGVRLAFPGWTGARQQAYGQPAVGPLSFGVSGIGRHFEVAEFVEFPGGTVPQLGYGVAGNVFIPVIPAKSAKHRGNALSLTGEFSRGTGVSDMYTDLTGGLLFPTLPNPQDRQQATRPPPVYIPNIDSGIVTFDGDGHLRTCDWQGYVVGLQYYLPILDGRVWISGIHSAIKSDNIVEITPIPGRGGVYSKSLYFDGSLFVALTDAIQMGFSFQNVRQTLGDGVKTQNYRSEFGMHMFF
jgi:hypothetical protein